ncbi:MAG: PHB depolymerase family esterase [Pseudomonadota bacterium]
MKDLFSLLVLVLLMPRIAVAAAPTAGVSHGKLAQDGVQRSYRLFIPQGLKRDSPVPLVVALHGGLGTGDLFAKQTGFDAVAQAEGLITVYPDGLGKVWNAGRCCGGSQSDDVGFIKALVADLMTRLPIDAQRVFGTGFSNGAMLTHRLACEVPQLFAAIAPVSGGLMLPSCASKTPVSALLIQGRLDRRIFWEGGTFDGSYRPSMAETVQSIASRGDCDSEVKTLLDRPDAQCWSRTTCGSGVRLQWCGLPAVGHQWPGGKTYFPRLLGPNTETFDASAQIGAFFSGRRLTP